MKINLTIPTVLIALLILFSNSCADLDVVNEMEPDRASISSDPENLMALAGKSFQTFHNEIQEYSGQALNMGVMADHITCPWGITRDLSWEPRINSYDNSPNYAYYGLQLLPQWAESYKAISYANTLLQLLDEENETIISEEQKKMLEAFSWFVTGVSHGYLGLIFDRAQVVRYNSDIGYELQPWNEVIDESLLILDRAIEIADANTFDIPVEWVGGQSMTNIELSQLANGYAARILAYSSRTSHHNSMIDWNRVLAYASNGMDWDFSPELGDAYDCYDYYFVYARYPGWGRVDMRIINLMDHDYPSRWPRDNISWNTPDGLDPEEADPVDARLISDFEYLSDNNFPPDRGYYYFSHYRYSRYDDVFEEVWSGNKPKPSFLSWEVRLLEAEALYRTGNVGGALQILNDPSGPRKVRGLLPDVNPSTDDILRLILDEKEIECYGTGAGISFFDMRRTDRLQPQTLLHFPVPSGELEIMMLPFYTIHAKRDGIDGSAGWWSGWDQ